METYRKLRERHMEEMDKFPLGAAFSEKQFDEMMIRFGLRPDETAEIYSLGAGVFCKKADYPAFEQMLKRHKKEIKDAMKNEEFAYEGFLAEMFDHECGYTGEFGEAIMALGLSLKDISDSKVLSSAYDRARSYALSCA